MFNTYQIYSYKCIGCQTIRQKMDTEQPSNSVDCEKCKPKDTIRFTVEGAPSGFVRNGSSNKAGFSKGKVFNG